MFKGLLFSLWLKGLPTDPADTKSHLILVLRLADDHPN